MWGNISSYDKDTVFSHTNLFHQCLAHRFLDQGQKSQWSTRLSFYLCATCITHPFPEHGARNYSKWLSFTSSLYLFTGYSFLGLKLGVICQCHMSLGVKISYKRPLSQAIYSWESPRKISVSRAWFIPPKTVVQDRYSKCLFLSID